MKTEPAAAHDLTVEALNERLNGYRVLREVGHGAMGIVFEARQRGLERRVAVKVLPPNLALRERTVKRFLREAEAMGRLAHANIVDVYEVGSVGALHYFAMRFVDGPPLDNVLRAGALGIGDVVNVGIDVSAALAHAHSRGVLHRDVKPSNLLRDGERVVLTDFGLAKPTNSDDTGSMTESGDLVGTPLYMSPEQILAEADGVDARADVWGLGATLYELLTGRTPFGGANAQGILNAILHRDPPLLRKLRADVPRDLEAVVLKCLEKDRGRRYSGAEGLHADLLAIQAGGSVSARPPRFFDPAMRWSRRNPVQTAAVAVAVGALTYFAVSWRSSESDLARMDSARQAAVSERDQVRQEKTLAVARAELLEANTEWSHARNDHMRLLAMERVGNLMLAMPCEQFPQIAVEIARVYAGFMHETGNDDRIRSLFNERFARQDSAVDLMMRAAMLEGIERFEEALSVHQLRARLMPRTPGPWLDGARCLWKLGLVARSIDDEFRARRQLTLAIGMLDQALVRAVRLGDENAAATVLIERARTLLDLGQREPARANLNEAIGHDPSRADALGLLVRCDEAIADEALAADPTPAPSKSSPPLADAGDRGPNDPTRVDGATTARAANDARASSDAAQTAKSSGGSGATPAEAIRALPLVNRMPTHLDLDTNDLADAGRNLQAIYRGMRDVFRTAAGVETAPARPPADQP